MPDEVLVKEQGVCRFAVKSGQEHVHDKKQVDLREVLLFHALGDVFPVSIELGEVIIRAEHIIVILHACVQIFRRVFVGAFLHVLVHLVCEDSRDLISFRIMRLHVLVILDKCLDLIDSKEGSVYVVVLKSCMLVQVRKDIVRDSRDTLLIVIEVVKVDLVAPAVIFVIEGLRVNFGIAYALYSDTPHILYREAQDVSVCDRLLDHVLVDTGIQLPRMEDVSRGLSLGTFVLLEDRSPCEPDITRICKVLRDLRVHLAELGAVAFVNDENTPVVLELVHYGGIFLRAKSSSHLLDGRHDQRL